MERTVELWIGQVLVWRQTMSPVRIARALQCHECDARASAEGGRQVYETVNRRGETVRVIVRQDG